MKCPVCGAAKLIHNTRDLSYTYKGETTVITQVTGDFCPACAESVLDAVESDRVMREMRAFSKQVNAAIVDPGFITTVRNKLALDQREAAEIFGGGVNAFSRYENGKTKPPLALVKLLKVLDRHPELLEEVREPVRLKEVKVPNATTRKATAELEAGKGERFASVDELMADQLFDVSSHLDDDEVMGAYMSAALDDPNPDAFLLALGNMVKARGMAQLARDVGVDQESLYKALAPGAKPRYDTILKLVSALRMKLTICTGHAAGLLLKPVAKKPRYTLAELLAQCDLTASEPADMAAWQALQPVVREL